MEGIFKSFSCMASPLQKRSNGTSVPPFHSSFSLRRREGGSGGGDFFPLPFLLLLLPNS